MSRWFRFYECALDDPKVQRLEPGLFKAWVNFLCLASRTNGNVSRNVSDVSFALRVTDDEAKMLISRLIAAGLIDETKGHYIPHNWNERQFKSDTSTERVKRFRKRSETVTETPPEQSRTDTEQNRTDSGSGEEIISLKKSIVDCYWPDMPPDTGRVDVWVAQGYPPDIIRAVVPEICRRSKPRSLKYCDKALDEACSKRAPPMAPNLPSGEAPVFIEQDNPAWPKAVELHPKTPMQTKRGRGAYFPPAIARQAKLAAQEPA